MMSRLFLLLSAVAMCWAVPTKPLSVPFVQPYTLATFSNFGLPGVKPVSSLIDIASRNYRTNLLVQNLQSQVLAAAQHGFAAGKKAGLSHAAQSLGAFGGYPGAFGGYAAAVAGAGYPGYPGGYPGYPGGTSVEQVHIGGVPVAQSVHSVGVHGVPVAGVHGIGVANVPVQKSVHTALGPHGLPVTKSIKQIGGVQGVAGPYPGSYPGVAGPVFG